MDHSRFDDLSRALAISSRRSVLTSAVTVLLAALFGRPEPETALARRKKKKKRKKKPSACPANMSPCAADGRCVATELCCSVNDDCPEATFGPLECENGVCVCFSARNAPCGLPGGDWYCCGGVETCCNDGSCCEASCSVQAGECACPSGNEPCSLEDSGITLLSCCAAGDTCCADSTACCTTQCSAANSTRGGTIANCGSQFQCRCATRIEDGSPVCVDYSQGFGCPDGCAGDSDCTGARVCVDNTSCGLAEGAEVTESCAAPCA